MRSERDRENQWSGSAVNAEILESKKTSLSAALGTDRRHLETVEGIDPP